VAHLGFLAQRLDMVGMPGLAKVEVQIFAKHLSYKIDEYSLYLVKALLVRSVMEVAQRKATKTWTRCSELAKAMPEDL